MFPFLFGERPCQDQRVGNRNDNQNNEMKQVHFRGKVRIICKGAKHIDGGMDDDAGEQASAEIKDCDQQEADCDCKNNLTQVTHKIHAAAIEQIDDMPNAKSYT